MGFKLGSARRGSSSRLNAQANISLILSTIPLTTLSFLLVGGGGGGGQAGGDIGSGSGGGAGGVVLGNVRVAPGTVLTFVWGGGGAGAPSGGGGPVGGTTGSNTTLSAFSITTVTALGGGGGSPGRAFPGPSILQGKSGGSGSGGYPVGGTGLQPSFNSGNPVVSSQYGNPGGDNPAASSNGTGGGGAGGAGTLAPPSVFNTAGGLDLTIPSFSIGVAGGGNTAPTTWATVSSGSPGSPGGYGGQASAGWPGLGTSGNGGGGLIALMVPTPSYPGSAPGATVTTPAAAPGKTVLTYTASGSYTV